MGGREGRREGGREGRSEGGREGGEININPIYYTTDTDGLRLTSKFTYCRWSHVSPLAAVERLVVALTLGALQIEIQTKSAEGN